MVGRDTPGLVPRSAADSGPHLLETATPVPPATARNLGVAAATGDAFLFTDADCRPRPDWLTTLAAALERAPVAGGAVAFDFDSENRWALADNIASFHELLADRPADDDTDAPLGSLNLAVTREAWETAGPFDEELVTSEDFDWVLRARDAGLATAFEPRAVVEHADVRDDLEAVRAHARWYGSHLHAFRRRHPGVVGSGPTWANRHLLRLAAPLKAHHSARAIFRAHPGLEAVRDRALPGVVEFKKAWYRAVVDTWPRGSDGGEGSP